MFVAGIWDAGEGAADTLHSRIFKGDLEENRGVMDRVMLAQLLFLEVLGCVYQTSLGDKALVLWLAEKPCKYCLTEKNITISTITRYIYDIERECVYICIHRCMHTASLNSAPSI